MPAKSIPSRSVGRIVGRVVLACLLILGLLRLVAFAIYAATEWVEPLEAYHLEGKMAHLAWRVQHGVRLYPPWRDYPHVANFFGPIYFGLVGLVGRALGSSLDDLFKIGRTITLLASLGTVGLCWAVARRRWEGRWPALAAAIFGIGAGPMVGFGVMVRPDTLADFLGLAGFLLAVARDRRAVVAGGLLLIAAILTKQTTALYLAAAVLALVVDGRWRTGLALALGTGLSLVALVAAVTALVEPEFGPGLLGESRTPWDFVAYRVLLRRLGVICPDLLFGAVVGFVLWGFGPRKDPRLATLVVVLTLGSVLAAAKKGADLNYFLGHRAIAALAIAELWGALRGTTGLRAWALALVALLGIPFLVLSVYHAHIQARYGLIKRDRMDSPQGQLIYDGWYRLRSLVVDPETKILTDRGLLDVQQGERTVFGDPWLFRMLVESGQIDPKTLVQAIEDERYDWIVTTKDLADPNYATYEFGMPMPMVEVARRHYRSEGGAAGMFFYRPYRLADPLPVLPRP